MSASPLQVGVGGTWRISLLALGLFLLTAAVFRPTPAVDFLNCDDDVYVSENPYVLQGLTPGAVRWAFAGIHENYWIPLTWISYLVDVEMHGGTARGFRITNAALHGLNAALVFLLLMTATRRLVPSLLAAALFALHPLRVESVAWIAERKDVLSTCFALLGLLAYVVPGRRSWKRHLAVGLAMTASLMAKPMWVTFPLVLLVLDAWPLRRPESWRALVLEKLPWFGVSGVFVVLTLVTQGTALHGTDAFPLAGRFAGAIGAYAFYVGKMLWPAALSVVYHDVVPGPVAAFAMGLAAAALSVAAFRLRHRSPWLAAGWTWFVVVLAPVCGLIRVGTVQVADRFTYAPSIGLSLVAAWALAGLIGRWPRCRVPVAALSIAVLVTCAVSVRQYLAPWRDSLALFARAVALAPDSAFAQNNCGAALLDEGRGEEALSHFRRALQLEPYNGQAQINFAHALEKTGRVEESLAILRRMLSGDPGNAYVRNNLGAALCDLNRTAEAVEHFQAAIAARPGFLPPHYNLGLALTRTGRIGEALRVYERILALLPEDPRAGFLAGRAMLARGDRDHALTLLRRAFIRQPHRADVQEALGEAMLALGRRTEAATLFRAVVAADANALYSLNALAWIHATAPAGDALHDPRRAVKLAAHAVELTGGGEPSVLDTLAAALAADKNLGEALRISRDALRKAETGGHAQLAREIQQRITCYESGRPWVDATPGDPAAEDGTIDHV